MASYSLKRLIEYPFSFVCDAPARAFLKCIKTHNGYSCCERCLEPGEYFNGRVVLTGISAPKRNNRSFRMQLDEEHHIEISPLKNHFYHSEEYLTSGQDFIFQQDSEVRHTSKQSLKWLDDYSIPLLEWVSSSSSDLSPIETLRYEMKKMLRKHPARTISELKQKLQEIWDSFTPKFCQDLIDTMPQRISAVIKNKGDVTQW
ncbi:hypothetical protein ILUMI_20623 [Ignelater luminosus]|uniref:Transposable element Tcb1 transposase n=1 Tax=Ignelater luminosus TaxID=2038154 RepID=A0A8K0FYR5_IGNLU|nr:hypothetical protein ILUMI_20623 [Ignelater luminosus]